MDNECITARRVQPISDYSSLEFWYANPNIKALISQILLLLHCLTITNLIIPQFFQLGNRFPENYT